MVINLPPSLDTLLGRIDNWSRWARLDPDRPDSSCQNSVYDMGPETDAGGYGEITAATVVMPHAPVVERAEIDHQDAESLDFMVRQMPSMHRRVLVRRYVLRERVDRLLVQAAVRSLQDMLDANRAVVAGMRGHM